jgi:glucose-1-phosphate cytidylyltransferase
MKVIILAGGYGTRLSEYTESIPKPMLYIGGKPIMWHIMKTYGHYGHKDFYLALGYKSEVIKEYFLNYRTLNADFTVDLATGTVTPHQLDDVDWKVTLVDTGLNTMTGGRIKRLQTFIGNETFLLTYGDGVSNLDLSELLKFHKNHGKLITVTAVHPGARFGELQLEDSLVASFLEKPQLNQGWINGGYFVIEPEFFDLISGDSVMLEREPLEQAARSGELMAYKHDGFWKCMDTLRDKTSLIDMWDKQQAPWKIW